MSKPPIQVVQVSPGIQPGILSNYMAGFPNQHNMVPMKSNVNSNLSKNTFPAPPNNDMNMNSFLNQKNELAKMESSAKREYLGESYYAKISNDVNFASSKE